MILMYKMCVILAGLLMALPSCGKQSGVPGEDNGNVNEPVRPETFVRYKSNAGMLSKTLVQTLYYDIMLPVDYEENEEKRYPVVYMLHGYGDNNTSWNDQWLNVETKITNMESYGLEPMIYVFPNSRFYDKGEKFYPYWCNTYDGKIMYMDMFINELVPYIDSTYRTVADREHRAAVGYSMGGFGAMILPLKHNEVFSVSVPLSMSFRTDSQYVNESLEWTTGWDHQWGKVFGGVGQYGEGVLTDYYKEHCPFYQFTEENAPEINKVAWFLHCGDDEEQLLIGNDALHVQMRDNGIVHEYRVGDGAHTSEYWRNALEETLRFVQSHFNGKSEWDYTIGEAKASEIVLDAEGNFVSSSYSAAGDAAHVVYLATEFDSKVNADIMSILQKYQTKAFIMVPFNPAEISVADKVAEIEGKYNVGRESAYRQAVAFGEAGKAVFAASGYFSRLYFDNADIVGDGAEITVNPDIFYLIAQSDDGPNYKDMGGLYVACKAVYDEQKKAGKPENDRVDFQYRVRNTNADESLEILLGAETIRKHIKF